MSHDMQNDDTSTVWLGTPPSVDEIREKINEAGDYAELSQSFDNDESKVDAALEILDAEIAEESDKRATLAKKKERQDAVLASQEPMIQTIRDSAKAVLSAKTGVPEEHYQDLDTRGLINATERFDLTEQLLDKTAALTAEQDIPGQKAALAEKHDLGCPKCGAASTSSDLGDSSDRSSAILGEGSDSTREAELAKKSLVMSEVMDLSISGADADSYVSEVYDVDISEYEHADDLGADLRSQRGEDDVERRRRHVRDRYKRQRKEQQREEWRSAITGDVDEHAGLAGTYRSENEKARSALSARDFATLSAYDGSAETALLD